jgi:hypothetical protein
MSNDDYPSWVDTTVKWESDVNPGDFAAAASYLSIRYGIVDAGIARRELTGKKPVKRRANDILRSVRREPLPMSDPGVAGELRKILTGQTLSPVIIARGDIADGYHRVSLAYNLDPFASVAVVIS